MAWLNYRGNLGKLLQFLENFVDAHIIRTHSSHLRKALEYIQKHSNWADVTNTLKDNIKPSGQKVSFWIHDVLWCKCSQRLHPLNKIVHGMTIPSFFPTLFQRLYPMVCQVNHREIVELIKTVTWHQQIFILKECYWYIAR